MAQVERAVARALVLAHINFFSCLFLHLLPSSTVTVLYYSFSSFILFTNSPSFLLLIRVNLYSFVSRSFKSILKRNIKDVPVHLFSYKSRSTSKIDISIFFKSATFTPSFLLFFYLSKRKHITMSHLFYFDIRYVNGIFTLLPVIAIVHFFFVNRTVSLSFFFSLCMCSA
jgi:hypothetical protein